MTTADVISRIPSLPFLGNLPEYVYDPLAFLTRYSKRGDVVRIRLGPITSYIVSDPNLIEYVLLTGNRNFVKDRFLRGVQRVVGQGLLTSEGDFWRRQRRLAQPAFHRERIQSYADDMVRITEAAMQNWSVDRERDIHADMMHLALDIAARTLFSADVSEKDARDVEEALEAVMIHFTDPFLVMVPALERLPFASNRRYQRGVKLLDDLVFGLIRKRRQAGAVDNGDLLSMLLAARDEDGSAMSDVQIRDEVMTLFLAGHETTAITLSWIFHLLAKHPRVRNQLEAELSEVLGDRTPTINDVPKLRYAEAIVNETMRLYPPAWSLGREASVDLELGGHPIPAGAQVWLPQWTMHRDARWFSDPLEFRPERWLDGLAKRLPRFVYFPFGGGPRQCIGNAFAMLEATVVMATIAKKFRFASVPGHPVVPLPSITLRPKYGIRMRLSARS